jgi:hypothetical protein
MNTLAFILGLLLVVACQTDSKSDERIPVDRVIDSPARQASGDRLTYLDEAIKWLEDSEAVVDRVGEQASILADNPSLIPLYEDEALELSIEADRLQGVVHGLNPPPDFRETNDYLVLAADALQESVENWWLGLVLFDIDLIESATDSMNESSVYIELATEAMP